MDIHFSGVFFSRSELKSIAGFASMCLGWWQFCSAHCTALMTGEAQDSQNLALYSGTTGKA